MLWKACTAVLGALLVALAAGLGASPTAADDDLSVEIAGLDDSQFPSLAAVVNVLDVSGRPITGLSTDSFGASLEGEPATVESVRTAVDAEAGLAVVLVVDVSGSMSGDPLTEAKSAATDFVRGLSPQDSVAVLTFSDSVSVAQDFSADKEAVITALNGLQAVGNTALFEATSQAVVKAAESPSPRKVIILLSDGVDYGGLSTVSRDDSIALARAVGIPFYTIGLGSEIDRSYLGELAAATGASFLETPTPQGLTQLYADIGNLLRGQYVLQILSPALDRSQALTLELAVTVDSATAVATRSLPIVSTPVGGLTISLHGVPEGQKIETATTIIVAVSGGTAPVAVDFLVDGESVAQVSTPPYQLSLDPATLTAGPHVLKVQASDATGTAAQAQADFSVVAPAGGGGPNVLLLIALLLLVIAGGGLYLRRRRVGRLPRQAVEVRLRPWSNSGTVIPLLGSTESIPPPEPEPVPTEEPVGKLIVTAGPNAGQVFAVSTTPVSIGSADWCDIVLADDDGRVGPEEARAWVHQNKLVFHKLTRLSVLASEGPPGGWTILQNGDEIVLGPYRLSFEIEVRPSAEEEGVNRALNDAVRRFGPGLGDDPAPTETAPPPPIDASEPAPGPVEEERFPEASTDDIGGPAAASDEAASGEAPPTLLRALDPSESPPSGDASSEDSEHLPPDLSDRASA